MELKGTQTEKNLQTAFAGESQAHTKYLYYASKAAKDGYVQISELFTETAKNEKEHAKLWFKFLHDGDIPILTCKCSFICLSRTCKWHLHFSMDRLKQKINNKNLAL
jgi:rubrerythrin